MRNNEALSRYELEENGHIAYADYAVDNGVMSIKYVFSPPELRGTGVAGKLMGFVMEDAKAKNYKVVPICGYAAAWIKKSKQYNDMVV